MVQKIARDLCIETAVVIIVIGQPQRQKETKPERRDGKRYADCEVSFHNTRLLLRPILRKS